MPFCQVYECAHSDNRSISDEDMDNDFLTRGKHIIAQYLIKRLSMPVRVVQYIGQNFCFQKARAELDISGTIRFPLVTSRPTCQCISPNYSVAADSALRRER